MAGKEPYLYIATRAALVRVALAALLDGDGKKDIPLNYQYIDFTEKKLPEGSIPLYFGGKLFLARYNRNSKMEEVVEVALDVPWDVGNAIRPEKVVGPVPELPLLGGDCDGVLYETPVIMTEFDDKLFFFHSLECQKEIGYPGEIIDLKTGAKHFIRSPPPFNLGNATGVNYAWGPYFIFRSQEDGSYAFDMRKEEWRVDRRNNPISWAALEGKISPPFITTSYGVAHLGDNLYIAITGHFLDDEWNLQKLVLYQFSSDDLTEISDTRVLDELAHLFEPEKTPGCILVHLGSRVVCMASVFGDGNLDVATFQVTGCSNKAFLLCRSTKGNDPIPEDDDRSDLSPLFVFAINHSFVDPRPAKRFKPDAAPVATF